MMKENDIDVLESVVESLRPRQNKKIMDLVAEAGIDVAPWRTKKDGSAVKNPQTNPAYCFQWAFGGNGQPTVVCIWHSSLAVSQELVFYEDSILRYASKLNLIAIDSSQSLRLRTRARKQEARAQHFDSLIQSAYRRSQPIRVVLLLGYPNSGSDIGWDTSKVQYRMLDSEAWYVHSYSDGDGLCRLLRKIPPETVLNGEGILPTQPVFVDQFSLPAPAAKHESTGFIFDRSAEVRRAVLERAVGVCECCGVPGFKMDNGRIFLETHHVIPLSKNGPDEKWNVVAICPNDHRRAHFGEDRVALRDQFIEHLLVTYPIGEGVFRALSEAASDATSLS